MAGPEAPRVLSVAMVGALVAWAAADALRWWGMGRLATGAEAVHLVADVLFGLGVLVLARSQRPVRPRTDVAETLLVTLAVGVPMWLLVLRPGLDELLAETAGGTTVLTIHLAMLVAVVGVVVWHLVGDVVLAARDEVVRGTLVLLVLLDLGLAVPGGTDPGALDLGLEALRLGVAGWLALAMWRDPGLVGPRETGSRGRGEQGQGLVVWVAVALIGPMALAGWALAGDRDRHAIAVAGVASVAGVSLLAVREWWSLQDVRRALGRERRRAARHARRVRRLAERDRARTTFLGAASHDLRTPLMAIRGSAELLATHDARIPADRRRALLGSLVRNTDRLEQLLTSLLDVERLSGGAIRARREVVDVLAIAREVALLPHLRDRDVTVADGIAEAEVDPLMVERILDNLLLNAVRHTPPGTPVWVDATPVDAGIRLVVSDAGPGIPPEERDRVLEAFARLDASEGVPGSGLGLSLVEGFARLHGGGVTIDERPGGGARFVVDLPGPDGRAATASEASQGTPVPAAVELAEPLASRLRSQLAASIDDEHAVDVGRAMLLRAEQPDEVLGLVAGVVAHLGGELVSAPPPRTAGTGLELGVEGAPHVHVTGGTRVVRARLRAHVPPLLEDARRAAWLLAAVRRRSVTREVMDALAALPERQRSRWLDWAEEVRIGSCVDLAREVARRQGGAVAACDALLAPAQVASGRRWQEGRWVATREHVVTCVVEGTLGALEADLAVDRPAGTLVAVCAVDEQHQVPLRMAALVWREAGWQVHLVGLAPPCDDLAVQLEQVRPVAVMVSCTTPWHLPGVVDVVRVAHAVGVPVVLGGAAVDPAGRRGLGVGADATSPDPRAALSRVTDLAGQAPLPSAPVLHDEVALVRRDGARVVDRVLDVAGTRTSGPVPRSCVDVVLRSAAAAAQVDDVALLEEVVAWLASTLDLRNHAPERVEQVLESVVRGLPAELVDVRAVVREVLARREVQGRLRAGSDEGEGGSAGTCPE